MSKENCLSFDGTSLQPCEPPEWYANIARDADANGGDWMSKLASNGIHLEQKYGEDLGTIDVYKAGQNGYFVEYWDMNQCIANIFIEDVCSYLEFRSKHLYAWAWLIGENERRAEADYERSKTGRKRA
ncbi:hypothetical protein [Mesorhizobium mediterraneum]|uniref:hypothetical protein n=1 Tax=Mesorhizobium mediterraneum TaxID=43617 RepID=UPI0017810298|nr:hypothetical protein [Mesorhizobium mediterraneum]